MLGFHLELASMLLFAVEAFSFIMTLLDLLVFKLVTNHLFDLLLLLRFKALNGPHLIFYHRGFFRTGLSGHHRGLVKWSHAILRGAPD